jgi:hypothetical protein
MSKTKIHRQKRGVNLVGQRFGRWTVLAETTPFLRRDGGRRRRWICKCSCGTVRMVLQQALFAKPGKGSMSCGCLHIECTYRTHGMAQTSLYKVWASMRARCNNPNNKEYANYGARGIKVCAKWTAFEGFFADMGPTYQPGLSIDRIDNNGDYTTDNCHWTTQQEQMHNCSINHWLEFGGERLIVSDWARKLGIKIHTLNSRLAAGWSPERALTTPVGKHTVHS